MKYFATTFPNGGVSGVRETYEQACEWLDNQLQNTKATRGYVFEAITEKTVAPRTVLTNDLRQSNGQVPAPCDKDTAGPLNSPPRPNGHGGFIDMPNHLDY